MKQKIGRYMVAEKCYGGGWSICNKQSDDPLAYLEYDKPLKQWIFTAENVAVFSSDCLRDVAALLERLNAESLDKETAIS